MKRNVKLSEMIEELQKSLDEQGDMEIESIGTSSGSNSSFSFRANGTSNSDSNIEIKCLRDKEVTENFIGEPSIDETTKLIAKTGSVSFAHHATTASINE